MLNTHSAFNVDRVVGEQKSVRMYRCEGFPSFGVRFRSRKRGRTLVCELSTHGGWFRFSVRNVCKDCLDSVENDDKRNRTNFVIMA
jgi:hypothetical protein